MLNESMRTAEQGMRATAKSTEKRFESGRPRSEVVVRMRLTRHLEETLPLEIFELAERIGLR
jgi:hypothetical protein